MSQIDAGERRAALVVVHGIGKQPPLRTLGAFAQGLVRAAPASGPHAAPRLLTTRVGGRVRPFVRLHPHAGALDLFEYHWAEHSVGRLGAWETFAWLLGVSVAGLDFRRQVPYLAKAAGSEQLPWVLGRQLVHVAVLAAGAASLAVAALVVIGRAPQALAALRGAIMLLPSPTLGEGLALVSLLCVVATTIALARDLLLSRLESADVARRHRAPEGESTWAGMFGPASGGWRGPAWLALGSAVLATLVVGAVARPLLARYAAAAELLFGELGVVVALGAVAAAVASRSYLLTHVADIALYVTSDRVSARARTRRAILDEGEALLSGLLEQGYSEVYLAGHSLGSVIALDLLDRLARAPGAVQDPALERLKGLLTFGSPLDKVAYFFRQRPGEGEAIRSQLLSALHGVKRRSGLRDYGPYLAAPYRLPFGGLRWCQVHAPGDLLSDRLDHYLVDERVVLPATNPLTAHGSYWRSDAFFRVVLDWLVEDSTVLR